MLPRVVDDQLAGLRGDEFVDQLCAPQPVSEGGLVAGAWTRCCARAARSRMKIVLVEIVIEGPATGGNDPRPSG